MVFRVDIGSNLRPVKYLADGAVRVDATLTRTGVFTYYVNGKPFREYRPESEVFHPDSLASFEAVVVTDDHPPVPVTAANRGSYQRGRVAGEVRRDGTHMIGSLVIDDVALVSKMRAGKRQVSNGYSCDLDPTPGTTPDGEQYDAIQRNIRGNHVAIVDAGRAGSAYVRMDSDDGYSISDEGSTVSDSSTNDAKKAILVMDEMAKKLGEALAEIEALKVRCDKADAKADAAEARATKAETERDAAVVRADAAEKARTDAAAMAPEQVRERVALVTKATEVLGTNTIKVDSVDVELVNADERAIKCAVIKHVDGTDVAADKSPAYVDGRYDAAVSRATKADKTVADVRTLVAANGATKPTVKIDAEEKARQEMIERNRNAHKSTSEGN